MLNRLEARVIMMLENLDLMMEKEDDILDKRAG